MTAHIPLERLHALVFDHDTDLAVTAHLETCPTCRQQVDALRQLQLDLEIARRSQPSPAALDRYHDMFANVQTKPSPLQRITQAIQALLTWDSRMQPALMGVRSSGQHSYRQLYAAGDAEIEWMVEPVGKLRRVEGDVIDSSLQEAAPSTLLVELVGQDGEVNHIVETDAEGLFRFEHVTPGIYSAVITRPHAATIEVAGLEIV